MKIFNSHSHLGVDIERGKMGLKYIFDKSYIGWLYELPSESREDIKAYFEKVMTMKAFVQLKAALEKLYGNGLKLDLNTWDVFDERIKKAYEDPNHENHVLRDVCGYDEILLDDWIDIRSSGSNGVECSVALRCDFMFYGYSREGLESCEANNFDFFDHVPDNIYDYEIKMRDYIKESLEMGKCTALKVCMAYFRDLDFEPVDCHMAGVVYEDDESSEYIRMFQDYVMAKICEIAGEFNIPIQIHTGLGQVTDTSPINLMPLIRKYSNVRFSLLHGGFPWADDLLAVLYECPNAWLDICWMPSLSSIIARDTLINVLELIGTDRIMWGCDAATVEESYGALLAGIDILDEVNGYFINKGVFDEAFGDRLKEKILYSNAKDFFNEL
ncbi:Amidohydrolase [Dethiosulfatibacter aminovorans DSM 17477]|uniref:Amidohydrolase n=1 Tax=Dethiosulfatibacter aminovorans DSM 17477 TaxID=1121476 RepID=A0A1M6IXA8_9FIRM|nr:amidohydrolase family protein [Dethiosulfatibacter aminovorans]SHJ39024.1 Amidohydrolase [Dethiosulfatibacter aminovorans DSM 17477]